jgi:hypothetical protein
MANSRKTKNLASGITSLFLFFLLNNVFGGWVVYEQSYEAGLKEKSKVTYYISNQKLKLVEEGVETIFDLRTNTISIIIPGKSVFWTGTPEELKNAMQKSLEATLDEKLKEVSVDKRENLRKYYLDLLSGQESEDGNDKLDALLVNTGKHDKIAGHNSTRYALYVNRDLKEEFWISPDIPVNNEFDMIRYKKLLKEINVGMSQDMDYHSGRAYLKVLQTGLLMRSIEHSYGTKYITEVNKVKHKKFKDSVFLIPQKYRQVSYTELDFEGNKDK